MLFENICQGLTYCSKHEKRLKPGSNETIVSTVTFASFTINENETIFTKKWGKG